jgi:hypothetical protein
LKSAVVFYMLFFLIGCSISTKSSKKDSNTVEFHAPAAVAAAATVAAGQNAYLAQNSTASNQYALLSISQGRIKITVTGSLFCSKNEFINHNNYQAELYLGKKLLATRPIDNLGLFKFEVETLAGKHSVRLINRFSSIVTDQSSFEVKDGSGQFEANLNSCK